MDSASFGFAAIVRAGRDSARVRLHGMSITKLRPVAGFCAETSGAMTLFLATGLGIPISTTPTITGLLGWCLGRTLAGWP